MVAAVGTLHRPTVSSTVYKQQHLVLDLVCPMYYVNTPMPYITDLNNNEKFRCNFRRKCVNIISAEKIHCKYSFGIASLRLF